MNRAVNRTGAGDGIDIIIPVFGAAGPLDRCLSSLERHTNFPPHRRIIVVDGPQSEEVEEVLSRHHWRDQDLTTVLRNKERRGFVVSANRGMEASAGDVVLLNSDTEVTDGWLDRLTAAAASNSKIATVTPLSNAATICSLPEFLEDNLLPEGMTTDEVGAIVTSTSRREYPELPTGVGVCLYIRRSVLDAIGPFDEDRFGLGYGEENEFCIRATRAGFVHIADDSTFVYHAGQSSFGPERQRRAKHAMRLLRTIDRTYVPRLAGFIKSDPLAPVRERVVRGIRRHKGLGEGSGRGRDRSILHIVHGWPPFDHGGTEHYARRLATRQAMHQPVSAFARIADPGRTTGQRLAYLDQGVGVRLIVNNFDQRNPFARNALKDRRFEKEMSTFISRVKPDLVHVHHLSGLSASLMGVARRHRLPIVYQVQDWWALCARSNLWTNDATLCPGPSPPRCSGCLPMTGLQPRTPLNRVLYRFRRHYLRRQIRSADAYIMGSSCIRESYVEAGFLDQSKPIHVLDYGSESAPSRRVPGKRGDEPISFGFIGALMPHKGAHVAVEAFRGLDPESARLSIWGDAGADPEYHRRLTERAETPLVRFHGRFEDSDRPAILNSIDVLIVPSVGLESYGIVAREAMAAGVPVMVARRGALEEIEVDGRCGVSVPPDDPPALRTEVERLIGNPKIIDDWRRSLPPVTSIEEHEEAVDAVYREVLGGGRR